MNRSAKLNALDALYATLPKLNCQRKCVACCCDFGMTGLEQWRLEAQVGPLKTVRMRCNTELGASLGVHNVLQGACPLLKDGACSVYTIRPAICRLWGTTQHMRCPHGCQPERLLTEAEAFAFMREALRLSL
jgi:Fe-S-cluster containining protein